MPSFYGNGPFGQDGFQPGPFDDFLARLLGGGAAQGGQDGPQVHRVDLTSLMTQQAQDLLGAAASHAVERGNTDLDALHLAWATTQDETTKAMLNQVNADPQQLAQQFDAQLPGRQTDDRQPPTLTAAAKRALLGAHQIARATQASYIGPEHVLLALSADGESATGRLFQGVGVNPQAFTPGGGGPSGGDSGKGSATPQLDEYGTDLTERARNGELDPVIGRADEVEQTIEILSRRTKNNPVLVGEAGVGKTAIVEGIAQRIVDESVPQTLSGKRVVQLDISSMLSGARYRGDFEERMNKVISEVVEAKGEVIVFIDEVHTVVGAGGAEGAVDASNMLKPRLARGELHVIGATTLDEYRKNIEKDAALERRFGQVQIGEPSVEDTVAILTGLRERYEQHHSVHYTEDAVVAAARLSDRYINDRQLPDKAIDLIDQAGARVRLQALSEGAAQGNLAELEQAKDKAVAEERYEDASKIRDQIAAVQAGGGDGTFEVGETEIAEVISRSTGIPVSQLTETEKMRLRNLESELHERVIGQDDAVGSLARAVRRSRSGLGDPSRPVGSFLFLGPTGVGKTELAKALARSLFGGEDRMVRLDMSEFGERHTASRLVGAPPGYVGYGEAGELTEAVRRRPYSVVLLDEIEKAHPDVFNTLLQLLDDGRMTDGHGRTVDFSNTVLIMTSNLGSEIISSRGGTLGFQTTGGTESEQPLRERLMGKLRDSFRPEFLNRIDDVVVFRKLDQEQLHTITGLLLEETRERLAGLGMEIAVDEHAIAWLAEHGHQPEFGARPLRRTIQQYLDDPIADRLVDGELVAGQRVSVTAADGELRFDIAEAACAQAA